MASQFIGGGSHQVALRMGPGGGSRMPPPRPPPIQIQMPPQMPHGMGSGGGSGMPPPRPPPIPPQMGPQRGPQMIHSMHHGMRHEFPLNQPPLKKVEELISTYARSGDGREAFMSMMKEDQRHHPEDFGRSSSSFSNPPNGDEGSDFLASPRRVHSVSPSPRGQHGEGLPSMVKEPRQAASDPKARHTRAHYLNTSTSRAKNASRLSRSSPSSPPRPSSVNLYFYFNREGKILSNQKPMPYFIPKRQDKNRRVSNPRDDNWLIEMIKNEYHQIRQQNLNVLWRIFSLKTIGFAQYLRCVQYEWDEISNKYKQTAKWHVTKYKDTESLHQFQHILNHGVPDDSKVWLETLDGLIYGGQNNLAKGFLIVELAEVQSIYKVFILLTLVILLSTGIGLSYALIRSDISNGISISSYLLTVFSLILALFAAGEWVGLARPDSFAFVYSLEERKIVDLGVVAGIVGSETEKCLRKRIDRAKTW